MSTPIGKMLDDRARHAVERAFPGLRCLWVRNTATDSLEISVVGSADDLIRHGLIVPKMIELLPACGMRSYVPHTVRAFGMPFTADVRRARGDLFGVRRLWQEEAPAWRARLGIAAPDVSMQDKLRKIGRERSGRKIAGTVAAPRRRPAYLRLVVDNGPRPDPPR